MKWPISVLVIILAITQSDCSKEQAVFPISLNFNVTIPTAGNSWVMNDGDYISSDILTSEGIRNWDDEQQIIRTFFHSNKAGTISIGFKAGVSSGNSKLKVVFKGDSREILLNKPEFSDISFGNFQVENAGYYFLDIIGLEKEGPTYADINDILIGTENDHEIKFIKDEFYWGRRGPSVHLNYEIPTGVENIEWFYSEVLIPEGEDVIGSYFMANGFGEGYFGMQVNSPNERRILFSVWSPFQTDNPAEIPEEDKIKLLKKGEGVITGEFGNEGSGGQSYKRFNWTTGVPYGFLVGARPTSDNHTEYVAYFYDPAIGNWKLIAQFRRPKTNTFLKHLYAFLENFIPEQGVFARKGLYQNQWVYDQAGWHEVTTIKFTADNTARKENRLDYSGGVENGVFFLKNCGFTNEQTAIESVFSRPPLGVAPNIDFDSLE